MILQDFDDEGLQGESGIDGGVLKAPMQILVQVEREYFSHAVAEVTYIR